jgi:hypothetical protein
MRYLGPSLTGERMAVDITGMIQTIPEFYRGIIAALLSGFLAWLAKSLFELLIASLKDSQKKGSQRKAQRQAQIASLENDLASDDIAIRGQAQTDTFFMALRSFVVASLFTSLPTLVTPFFYVGGPEMAIALTLAFALMSIWYYAEALKWVARYVRTNPRFHNRTE